MGCTANCRRIHRSRFAVPATIPAWDTPEARAHRRNLQQRQAVHTDRDAPACLGPSLDPNLLSQGIPPDDRVTSTNESSDPLREHRCHWGPSRAGTPPVCGEQLRHRARWAQPRHRYRRGQHVDAGGGLPADSAARCSGAAGPAPPPPCPQPRPPAVIDGGRPQAAPSSFGGKATKPLRRSRLRRTIRVPVVMWLRTGSCTSNRIWQPRPRPRSGRTCFRLNTPSGWSADLVQPQRHFDSKPLVLPAGAARAERPVFPGHHRRPESYSPVPSGSAG